MKLKWPWIGLGVIRSICYLSGKALCPGDILLQQRYVNLELTLGRNPRLCQPADGGLLFRDETESKLTDVNQANRVEDLTIRASLTMYSEVRFENNILLGGFTMT